MHKLDHVVLGANTLQEGTDFVENILQTKLSDIGYHKDMGTHNRTIKINNEVYLEVVAIDPKKNDLKNKKWFNLDNSNLQFKLKKSPQIIGYVIENNNKIPFKYYDPFFQASRANYRWQFAMPSCNNNNLDIEIIETGIIPSLISWENNKPIYQMEKNQFELISFQIILSETQKHLNSFLHAFGEIEYVSVALTTKKISPILKLQIKDNLRNMLVSL